MFVNTFEIRSVWALMRWLCIMLSFFYCSLPSLKLSLDKNKKSMKNLHYEWPSMLHVKLHLTRTRATINTSRLIQWGTNALLRTTVARIFSKMQKQNCIFAYFALIMYCNMKIYWYWHTTLDLSNADVLLWPFYNNFCIFRYSRIDIFDKWLIVLLCHYITW